MRYMVGKNKVRMVLQYILLLLWIVKIVVVVSIEYDNQLLESKFSVKWLIIYFIIHKIMITRKN